MALDFRIYKCFMRIEYNLQVCNAYRILNILFAESYRILLFYILNIFFNLK